MPQAEQSTYPADYEQMVEFVEALIAKKYPGEPTENHAAERDQAIAALSDQIEDNVIAGLDESQQQQLNAIAEQDGDVQTAFLTFLTQSGVNLNQIIKDTMLEFANKFLGGANE